MKNIVGRWMKAWLHNKDRCDDRVAKKPHNMVSLAGPHSIDDKSSSYCIEQGGRKGRNSPLLLLSPSLLAHLRPAAPAPAPTIAA